MIRAQDITPDVARRFLKFIAFAPSGCWIWLGACHPDGHGQFRLNGRTEYAHRVAYVIEHGRAPRAPLIRHTCILPRCVNPAHLIPGNKSENARDFYMHKRLLDTDQDYRRYVDRVRREEAELALAGAV